MKQNTLQAVLRTLAAAVPVVSDGDLLRRHLTGDAEAFAELVRRHGRLVWSVCRHLTRSDSEADDAFQATFLVLLKNAATIRDAGRLSAWLHGVAYRISSRARRTANRRAARERAIAVSERNGHAVADSAWDRTLAVVHEEAGRLPEALRVPFVLCCLEGKPVTEAALQLGWKLGTLSGRLTRAKDALLARLEARGLTLGAIAALGLAAPPAAALARAVSLAKVGFVIPISILQLSQGVIGMSTFSFKVLAAGVLVACGLGVGVGSGWVPTAEAQTPQKAPPSKTDPDAEVKRLQTELDQARQAAEAARNVLLQEQAKDPMYHAEAIQRSLIQFDEETLAETFLAQVAQQRNPKETYTAKTTKWEYDFVVVSDMTQSKFVAFLQDRENRGWDYNGTTTLTHQGKPTEDLGLPPAREGCGGYTELLQEYYQRAAEPQQRAPQALGEYRRFLNAQPTPKPPGGTAADPKTADDVAREIARLQVRLAALNALKTKPKPAMPRLVIDHKDLPLAPAEMASVLLKLSAKKLKNANFTITPTDTGIIVEGDKEAIDWVAETVKKLGGN